MIHIPNDLQCRRSGRLIVLGLSLEDVQGGLEVHQLALAPEEVEGRPEAARVHQVHDEGKLVVMWVVTSASEF